MNRGACSQAASARCPQLQPGEVSRDTASPAPTMKRPWLGAALTGAEVRVELPLFLSGVVPGNHAFSRR